MVAELSKALPPMVGEVSLLPPLGADIALPLILPDLAIDLAIGRFLLVRVFFNVEAREEIASGKFQHGNTCKGAGIYSGHSFLAQDVPR